LGLLHGDLGYSATKGEPVATAILQTLPYTLQLVFLSLIFTAIIGIASGLIGARKVNKWPDKTVRGAYIIGFATPPFFIAIVVIVIFSLLPILPTSGAINISIPLPPYVTGLPMVDALIAGDWAAFDSLLEHAILPSLANALAVYGIMTRVLRSTLLDVMQSNFVTAARARGISERRIFYHYAFTNSLVTLVTMVALMFTFILGSTIFVEYIFSYPGMGGYVVQATMLIDYPSILATTLVFAIMIILVNLLADVLYAVVDPRIRYSK
jgi:peptide/nickel transport system permease protein